VLEKLFFGPALELKNLDKKGIFKCYHLLKMGMKKAPSI
jgi:hypothetical protein